MDEYFQYCQADREFYDHPSIGAGRRFAPADRRPPEGWVRELDGHWVYLTPVRHNLPEQGWKIHVSVTRDDAEEVIEAVADYCLAHRISFKFLASPHAHLLANIKYAPRGSSGKLITIYPVDDDELHKTLLDLSAALDGYPGPYILSDLRWGRGPLYLRFGGFRLMYCTNDQGHRVLAVRRPDGTLVPDVRGPGFVVPDWLRPPDFVAAEIAAAAAGSGTGDGLPYAVEKALHFSNGGGIYLARGDGPAAVVLREARPHAGLDPGGRDAVARLRHEATVLEALSDLDFVPGFRGRFAAWEHEFLVEEYIEGEPLWSFVAKHNPLSRGRPSTAAIADYTASASAILADLDRVLDRLHERGYVFADLHPGNIIVRDDGRVALVDFEIAHRPDSQPAPDIGAPGFVAAHAGSGVERDRYALDCLRLAVFLPLTQLLDLAADKVDGLVDAVAELFPVPVELTADTRAGLRRPGTRPVTGPTPADEFAAAAADPARLPDLHTALGDAILTSATPQRQDRLYPGDPAGLRDGGYNLAHGAAGVLYALAAGGRAVPAEHVDWLAAAVGRSAPVGGLYNGLHGAAVVLHALGREDVADQALRRTAALADPVSSLGLFGGLAGIGLALRYFANVTGDARWRVQLDDLTALLADRLEGHADAADGPTEPVRPGLLYGRSGVALFCLRRYADTDDPALLDLAGRALAVDLAGCRLDDDGDVVLAEDGMSLTHLAIGSAGLIEPLDRYLRYRPDERLAALRDGMVRACGAPFTAEAGLFLGRAGLITALAAAEADRPCSAELAAQVRRLGWHAVRYRQGIAFPGRWLLRLSMDLATGTAGVLLALNACARAWHRGPAPVPAADSVVAPMMGSAVAEAVGLPSVE